MLLLTYSMLQESCSKFELDLQSKGCSPLKVCVQSYVCNTHLLLCVEHPLAGMSVRRVARPLLNLLGLQGKNILLGTQHNYILMAANKKKPNKIS